MEKRSHISRIEVRFVDIDVMGHVNNAVYLNYFEQARMHFFAHYFGILLARNEIDYKEPTLLNDDVHIETWIAKVGTKSLELEYEVYVPEGESRRVKAKGKSVLVCFDYNLKQTIEVPAKWKALIEA
jgi:acyl-CoA thioester hydrolase